MRPTDALGLRLSPVEMAQRRPAFCRPVVFGHRTVNSPVPLLPTSKLKPRRPLEPLPLPIHRPHYLHPSWRLPLDHVQPKLQHVINSITRLLSRAWRNCERLM